MKENIHTKKNIYAKKEGIFQGNEIGFQKVCQQQLPKILEHKNSKLNVYFCEALLTSYLGDVKPDLFAIAEDYSYFCIIEVETSNHDFIRHVFNQMEKITNADYELSEKLIFNDLCKRNRKFSENNRDKFQKMIHSVDPEYLVVSDNHILFWQTELAKIKVRYMSISSYSNSFNIPCYKVIQGPKIQEKAIYRIEWRHFYFAVKSVGISSYKSGEVLQIHYKDNSYDFTVKREKKNIFLFPEEKFTTLALESKKLQSIERLFFENGLLKLGE